MIKYLSVENYYGWKANKKEFNFYRNIIRLELITARVLQNENGTWGQVKYNFTHEVNGNYLIKEHILQRKYNIYNAADYWRFRKI